MNINNPETKVNYILYFFIFLLTLGIKYFYSACTVDFLSFILYPTTLIVELITGFDFLFIPAEGYSMIIEPVIINKTCAGLNFLIIVFSMTSFMAVPLFNRLSHKVILIALTLILSYAITISVNAFRISISLFLLHKLPQGSILLTERGHQIIGIVFYFTFLLLSYLTIKQLIACVSSKRTAETITV